MSFPRDCFADCTSLCLHNSVPLHTLSERLSAIKEPNNNNLEQTCKINLMAVISSRYPTLNSAVHYIQCQFCGVLEMLVAPVSSCFVYLVHAHKDAHARTQ